MNMQKKMFIFSSQSRLRLALCFTLLSIVGVLMMEGGPRHAYAASISTNSLVIIAVDLTPPSCKFVKVIRSDKTHALLSRTQTHCPAGSYVGTQQVPLSVAVARHEQYMLPLSTDASLSMKEQSNSQIQQLIDAKRKELQPLSSPPVVHPNYSCGFDESVSTSDSFYGTWMDFAVYYHVLTNCSNIVINREEVLGFTPVVEAAYWIRVAYDGWGGGCPVGANSFIGSNDLNAYPGVSQPIGFYNVWSISSGNPCYFSGGGLYINYSVPIFN